MNFDDGVGTPYKTGFMDFFMYKRIFIWLDIETGFSLQPSRDAAVLNYMIYQRKCVAKKLGKL